MSRSTNRDDGTLVREFLSVADLLEKPELAQLYADHQISMIRSTG